MSNWTRSSFCSGNGECVEVQREHGGWILLRGGMPPAEMLVLSPEEWDAFVAGVKAGEFDHLKETP